MSDNKIKFWKGTSAQYTKDTTAPNSVDLDMLYFITDTKQVFLGGNSVAADNKSLIDTTITDLEGKITEAVADEATARTAAINAEKAAREAADTALESRIDGVITDYKDADTKVKTDLTTSINAVSNKIGDITDTTVASAISRLDAKDDELNTKIDGLILSGGAMVFSGTFANKTEFDNLVKKGIGPGASFVVTAAINDLYGHKVEIGDMIIYLGKEGVGVPNTNPASITTDMLTVVQANLTSAIQSQGDNNLSNNALILGAGNKEVKASSITESALSSAIANANNAVLKTGDQTMAGKLTASGFVGPLTGNASSATTAGKLTTSQNFSIKGGVTAAAVAFNGTSGVELNVTDVDAGNLSGNFPTTQSASTTKLGVVKIASGIGANDTGVTTGAQIHTAIADVNSTINGVGTRVSTLETAVGESTDIASSSGSLYARIASVKATADANTTAISKLSTRVGDNETDIGIINTNISNMDNSIKTNRDNITSLSSRLVITESQLTWVTPQE